MTDIPRDDLGRPRVFLEEDCPVAELSVESQRERGASSALPPLYFLHVWWARRPLTVSRAAVLGSLLPANFDRKAFLRLMGIHGDPVKEKKRLDEAHQANIKLKTGYSYSRAYTNKIPYIEHKNMKETLLKIWNTNDITILDSFAGGGSIPFEIYRLGFKVISNELNPVANIIQRATIEYPAKIKLELITDLEKYGKRISNELENRLADCFPKIPGEEWYGYIWVRTILCPQCELKVPLAPNWWLDKSAGIGYQMVVPLRSNGNECSFAIREVGDGFDPDHGSVMRGVGICPRCGTSLDSIFIKSEAQAGRMDNQMVIIRYRKTGRSGTLFREVTEMDLEGMRRAKRMVEEKLPRWEAEGVVPTEQILLGSKTRELINKGMNRWIDLFNPRQLLVHLTTMELIRNVTFEKVTPKEKRDAIRVYLQLAFDKTINYNSLQSNWHPTRVVVANTFDRHDFAFKWSTAEIDGAGDLFKFGLSQIIDAYRGLAKLLDGTSSSIEFLCHDAAQLGEIEDGSVTAVIIDPPYYDNVMYAELSDFFYVWMKRGLGDIFPDLFRSELTDKENEAVANVARFKQTGRGKARSLAEEDYKAKMAAAFREMHRVLRPDGVMTVMFTHKRVDAWDTLGQALLDAGFEVSATWPIHTESEHSLHQAKKNAAASTILLVCRKRSPTPGSAWWDDIKDELRTHVRERANRFASMGLRGQDTSIACFGPALQVISQRWPVRRKTGEPISPDEALDLAREEVNQWFLERIAEGKATHIDKWTRYYVLAWYLFQAREFPYDEARKLAISVDVDIDRELIPRKMLEKKGNNVRLVKPGERFRKGGLRPDAKDHDWDLDYVHAAIHAYETGQSQELTRFHQRTAALQREGYRHAIGYLLDVLPRTDEVTEYHTLDKLWEANMRDSVARKRPRTMVDLSKMVRIDSYLEDTVKDGPEKQKKLDTVDETDEEAIDEEDEAGEDVGEDEP